MRSKAKSIIEEIGGLFRIENNGLYYGPNCIAHDVSDKALWEISCAIGNLMRFANIEPKEQAGTYQFYVMWTNYGVGALSDIRKETCTANLNRVVSPYSTNDGMVAECRFSCAKLCEAQRIHDVVAYHYSRAFEGHETMEEFSNFIRKTAFELWKQH